MPFKTTGKTNDYIRSRLAEEKDELLREMTKYADDNFIPVLLPESAALLKQVVMLIKPEKSLEIGTAIGYSSQLILRNGGNKLYTLEIKEELIEKAKSYFARAG